MFDLKSPQVVIRPIITIDGGHSVNEVFFDNLRVPLCDVVGIEGQGWNHVKFMLANERTANSQVPRCKRDLALLRQIAARETAGRGCMLDLADIKLRIAQLEIDLYGLEWSLLRELLAKKEKPGRRLRVENSGKRNSAAFVGARSGPGRTQGVGVLRVRRSSPRR